MTEPDMEKPIHTDPQLLELLVCPLTKTSLQYDAERQELVSRAARLAISSRSQPDDAVSGIALMDRFSLHLPTWTHVRDLQW